MTILNRPTGALQTDRMRISGTGVTTVMDPSVNGAFIDLIYLVNTGAATVNVTVDAYDVTNATAYVVLQEHTLQAKSAVDTGSNNPKSVYTITFSQLLRGTWALRVTSSVGGNVLHVHVTHALPEQRR